MRKNEWWINELGSWLFEFGFKYLVGYKWSNPYTMLRCVLISF